MIWGVAVVRVAMYYNNKDIRIKELPHMSERKIKGPRDRVRRQSHGGF